MLILTGGDPAIQPVMKPIKVLHLLSQVPDATGSGIYLQAALRHAQHRGYENFLLAGVPVASRHHEKLTLPPENFRPLHFGRDLPFHVVGMSDVMPYPSTRFSDLNPKQLNLYLEQFEHKLVEAVTLWQPDLIHSHHLWLLTSLAKQKFPHIPMLTSCHGSDLRQFHNCPHLHELVLPGCRRVDKVCALSVVQKLEIQQLYGIDEERIEVVGAGYDRHIFYRPENSIITPRPLQLLYAGKLSRAKGVPWLLTALQRLSNRDFIFHLIGDGHGEERDQILQQAQTLGDRVRIHGNLDQQSLAELMRSADIFILPSFFEGLPLVLLEALACGCRIITTALPGVAELFSRIESDWVELIELPQMIAIDSPHPADEEDFTARLVLALEQQRVHMADGQGSAACAAVDELLDRYTWEGIFTKIEQLYRLLRD
ncbi:MAG: glycosyltransferase family 4 protein [Desulfuromonadales bacterium]|nr:glycosyltransferase family 4 protein [Desulfuromonadales bacterium]MBN2791947.1 glycosyltransferase family 4 protein [Desulfuromonadales bacterium]